MPAFPEDRDGERPEEEGWCEGEYAWELLPNPFCNVGLSVSNIGAAFDVHNTEDVGRYISRAGE